MVGRRGYNNHMRWCAVSIFPTTKLLSYLAAIPAAGWKKLKCLQPVELVGGCKQTTKQWTPKPIHPSGGNDDECEDNIKIY
jgi:hypothetical protein